MAVPLASVPHAYSESRLSKGNRALAWGSSGTPSKTCPECGSEKLWRDGLRYSRGNNAVQRWLCRVCGFRFSDGVILNASGSIVPCCRVRVADGAMNNLVEVETRQEQAAGATTRDLATIKGKIVEFALWLKKQGYDDEVAKWRSDRMWQFVKAGANLWDPESVKEILATRKSWSDGYKMLLLYAYENFLQMEQLTWIRPHYCQQERLPFIPTETELDQLIASCGKKLSIFLQGLKDTGADPGELTKFQPTDISVQTRMLEIRPVKGHNSRVLPVSKDFITRIQTLKSYEKGNRIFSQKSLVMCLYWQRKRAAQKFNNPRLQKISFTTFRHWRGTMEYHRTKDILHVKSVLGHKQIRNTLKYIHLEQMLFNEVKDQYITKIALNVKEACALAEVGFEYVTGEYNDGGKIFRKLKDYMDKTQIEPDRIL